jgi:hypothetical protein
MAVQQTTWASRAFIAAGVLMLAAVTYSALGAFEPGLGRYEVSYPLVFIAVGGSGLAAAIGLLGLYPLVRQRLPRLAMLGAAGAAVGGLGALSAIAVGAAGRAPWDLGSVYNALTVAALLAIFATCLLFGIAILRTELHARVVGGLLALVGLPFLAPVIDAAFPHGAPEWLFLGIIGLAGAALLGVGTTLRATTLAARPAAAPQRA